MDKQLALGNEYAPQMAFTKTGRTKLTIGGEYFTSFFRPAYDDGARIARDYVMTSPPLRQWRWQADKDKKGEALGWQRPDFDDRGWKTTDPCVGTWFALGLDAYYGTTFYRASVHVPAVPAGKKVYLWISSTDGTARLVVNGRPVPYVNAKGEIKEEFSGYCRPASFDITAAVRPSAGNQITIICARPFMNEIGTGGLTGPAYLYQERP